MGNGHRGIYVKALSVTSKPRCFILSRIFLMAGPGRAISAVIARRSSTFASLSHFILIMRQMFAVV